MSPKRNRARGSARTATPAARGAQRSGSPRVRGRRGNKRWFKANQTALMAGAVVVFFAAIIGIGLFRGVSSIGGGADFEFTLYQGEEVLGSGEHRFSDILSLGKPVVLNFWAGNCPPCRAEMPDFQRVYEQHKDDIILLGLDVGPFTGLGTRQQARDLLNELGVTYPAGFPPTGAPVTAYRITAFPSTVVFDKAGNVSRTYNGTLSAGQLDNIVRNLTTA